MIDGKFSHNNTGKCSLRRIYFIFYFRKLSKLTSTVPPTITKGFPLFSLKGRTAIVSGAGGGIGLAVAQGLAEAGADVVIWYNSNNAAIEKAKQIEDEYGVKCLYFCLSFQFPLVRA